MGGCGERIRQRGLNGRLVISYRQFNACAKLLHEKEKKKEKKQKKKKKQHSQHNLQHYSLPE